jgi:hypothetical protein
MKMDTPIKKPTHIVIEVCGRGLGKTRLCYSAEEAIDIANEMLEEHIKSVGCFHGYETGEDEWSYYVRASSTHFNPWCNYANMKWDAYIIDLKEG